MPLSSQEKEQLKQLNARVLEKACRQLWESSPLHPDELVTIPIDDLYDVKKGQVLAGCELQILASEQGLSILQIMDSQNNVIASREMLFAIKMIQQNGQVTLVTDAISTAADYEGNGFASVLMRQSENLLNTSVTLLRLPSPVVHFLTDNAHGQTQDRSGWSGNMAQRMGFSNDPTQLSQLADLVGYGVTKEELPNTYFKVYQF